VSEEQLSTSRARRVQQDAAHPSASIRDGEAEGDDLIVQVVAAFWSTPQAWFERPPPGAEDARAGHQNHDHREELRPGGPRPQSQVAGYKILVRGKE